ncbi:MAG: hypothetical protein II547_04760, partial [Treponema sp.]|nr:hypothetical protein [Treponema sp.]
IYFQVADGAGNRSTLASRDINVDTVNPTLEPMFIDRGNGIEEIPGTLYVNESSPSITLYGTASDAGGLAGVTFKLSGHEIAPSMAYTEASGLTSESASSFSSVSWGTYTASKSQTYTGWKATFTYAQIEAANSGEGVLSAEARDAAGNSASYTNITHFSKDTTAPNVSIISPTANSLIKEDTLSDNKLTVRGTWSDVGGSGTNELKWSVNGSTWFTDDVDAPATTALASWSFTIPKEKIPAAAGKTIYVKASDNAGNWSTPVTVGELTYDYALPEISLTAPASLQAKYGKSATPLTFTFTASDDRAIDSIELVEAKKNGTVVAGSLISFTDSATDDTATAQLLRNGDSDGTWSITVRAKDISGRYSNPLTVSTVIDGTAPQIDSTELKVENSAWAESNWYKNNVLRVSAKATDEDGSGLDAIRYKVVHREQAAAAPDLRDETGTTLVSVTGEEYTFNITASDLYESSASECDTLVVQAYDAAGNSSSQLSVQLHVDTFAPTVAAGFYKYGGTSLSPASGTIMTNGESDLTLYGSVSDYNQSAGSVQSGINGIRFTFTDTATGTESNLSAVVTYSNTAITSGNASTVAYGAEPGTGTVSYMAVISKAGLQSSGSIRAKVTDKAGNESTQLLFNIDRDNARPSITL